MALFGGKQGKSGETAEAGKANGAPAGGFSPEKARTFFDRARTAHDTGGYEFAMLLWLNGLGQDPSSIEGFQGFVTSADTALNSSKKVNGKEIQRGLSGKGSILKYQEALLSYALKPNDAGAMVKAAEAAGSFGVMMKDITSFVGRQALAAVIADKKQQKTDVFVRLLDAFESGHAFDLAIEAGQRARELAPNDERLERRVKEMMAQAAISAGGFEDKSEGGFRRNIRDAEKQASLEAADRLTKTEDVKDRLIAEARAALEERAGDMPSIEKLGRALLERGKNKDLLEAMTLYSQAYSDSGQFKFRQRSGEVQVRMLRNNVRKLRQKAEATKDSPEAHAPVAEQLAAAEKQLLETETKEIQLQVDNYPTDLGLKFELGKRLFAKGDYHGTITQLQLAQEDTKNRRAVLGLLAEAFLRIDYEDEAVGTFRQALEGIPDEGSELALELRHGLACALQAKAESARELEAAEEAYKLFSGIAMRRFDYKDVRERRDATKTMLDELRG